MKISKSKLNKLLSGFPISLKEVNRPVYIKTPLGMVKKIVIDTVPLNHIKEIKKFYHLGPVMFLIAYTEWFFKHHDKMVAKYPEHFIKVKSDIYD